jgi:hypothetical protein
MCHYSLNILHFGERGVWCFGIGKEIEMEGPVDPAQPSLWDRRWSLRTTSYEYESEAKLLYERDN